MRNPEKKYTDGKVHSWSVTAIRKILNNRFYLGEMAYGKSVRKSVGSQNGIAVPKEGWKVIRNHHEALIQKKYMSRYRHSDWIILQKETERSIRLQENCIAVDAVIP